MKTKLLFALVIGLVLSACNETKKDTAVAVNLKFNESTIWVNGELLVANFGNEGDGPNPTNNEGKGYIAKFQDTGYIEYIKCDGNLNAPKGMAYKDNYLYICDVNKLVVYNLSNLKESPKTLKFPEGEVFLNDAAIVENFLYVTVTNTSKVWVVNITDPTTINTQTPLLFANVPGANGIVYNGTGFYVAGYPADGANDKKIYDVSNITNPVITTFYDVTGEWDGLQLSNDGKTLYASNWGTNNNDGEIISINIETKVGTKINGDNLFFGPADFTLMNNKLYIPDLPKSTVTIINL